jgi:hypothetical protein
MFRPHKSHLFAVSVLVSIAAICSSSVSQEASWVDFNVGFRCAKDLD